MFCFRQYAIAAFLLLPLALFSDFTVVNSVSRYGWLDQYSMDTRHSFVGNEACVPTSSTNALTYLQNAVPQIFGDVLSGTTYAQWEDTDDYLIHQMKTTAGGGTAYDDFVYALHTYITETKGFSEVQFSGFFPDSIWRPKLPQPSYIQSGITSIPTLTNALAAGSAVLVSIRYADGGGHELLVNGLTWDPSTNTGTLYFIDPLDPSENYSPAVPTGPTKQTSGTITLLADGSLELEYSQYSNRLPYTGVYHNSHATLMGLLSVGGAAFVPFSSLVTSGNENIIAQAFDRLDPTTAAMFPVLAVLNTLPASEQQQAFKQLDPSLYNAVLLSQQDNALRIQSTITNNLLEYLSPCGCSPCRPRLKGWITPFQQKIRQKDTASISGYKTDMHGWTGGLDYLVCSDVVFGIGYSHAKNKVDWASVPSRAHIKNDSVLVYGAKIGGPLRCEASFTYSRNKIDVHRHIGIATPLPFVAPVNVTFKHRYSVPSFSSHLRASYDIFAGRFCNQAFLCWPYLNLAYANALLPRFREHGNSPLALSVSRQNIQLLQPEIGLGSSLFLKSFRTLTPFIHSSLGYAQEIRLGGKHTRAYFNGNPQNSFSVRGLYPQKGVFYPRIMAGVKAPDEAFQFHALYEGAFASGYTSNQVQLQLSFAF